MQIDARRAIRAFASRLRCNAQCVIRIWLDQFTDWSALILAVGQSQLTLLVSRRATPGRL